jgi:hypothetical protein
VTFAPSLTISDIDIFNEMRGVGAITACALILLLLDR